MENRTGVDFAETCFTTGGKAHSFGALPAGARRQVRLPSSSYPPWTALQSWDTSMGQPYYQRGSPARPERSVLNLLGELSSFNDPGRLALLVLIDRAAPCIKLDDQPMEGQGQQCYLFRLSPKGVRAKVALTSSYPMVRSSGRDVAQMDLQLVPAGREDYYGPRGAGFRLPGRVRAFTIGVTGFEMTGGPGPMAGAAGPGVPAGVAMPGESPTKASTPPRTSLSILVLDCRTGKFVPVRPKVPLDGARFATPDGRVTLKVKHPSTRRPNLRLSGWAEIEK